MGYRVLGLSPQPFLHLYGAPEAVLAAQGVVRCRVDKAPGFPDRVELRDAAPGQTVLLLNYVHQAAATPYRASHAIFVREGASRAAEYHNALPEVMRIRPLSLRAFDARDWMVDAEVVEGEHAAAVVQRLLAAPETAYLQAHYAKRGCYAARIERD